MPTHLRFWGGFALSVLASTCWAAEPESVPLTPGEAVQAALANHPSLRASEGEVRLARGQRAQSLFLLNNPGVDVSSAGEGPTEIDVLQPLSVTGEGWFARRSATAAIDAAESNLDRTQLRVAALVRQSFVDALVAAGRVKLAKDAGDLASRLRQAVARRHEEGEVPLLDLRLARLAEARAAASLLECRELEAEALQQLSAIVQRPLSSESLSGTIDDAAPQPTASAPSDRSDVVSARARLRAAQSQLSRQRAAAMPAVGVGVALDVGDGQTTMGPALSISLPLFDRNQSGRAAAHAEVAIAGAGLASIEARADTEQRTARRRHDEATELAVTLGEDPLSEAREALAGVQAGYLAGGIDLQSTVLLQAQVLEGQAAVIEFSGRVADARIDLLLATEDDALLGGAR